MSDPSLYGPEHRAARKAWQKRIEAGETIHCSRGCGRRLTGRAWDLGHLTREAYRGPECIPCNRATRTHAAAQRKRPKPKHPSDQQ